MNAARYWAVIILVLEALACISLFTSGGVSAERCLIDKPEVYPKRYAHYLGKSLYITLEVSQRVTHQLSSAVYKIFLQEVLGYPKVVTVNIEDHFDAEAAFDRLDAGPLGTPTVTVNLEVWVPVWMNTLHLFEKAKVHEGGMIGPPGRMGWFIPLELAKNLVNNPKADVHWTIFRDPKTASIFDVVDPPAVKMIEEASFVGTGSTPSYHCNDPSCQKGMYIPQQCRAKHSLCALLLAPDFNSTRFVINQVEEQKLYVKVVWLGMVNLKKTVDRLRQKYAGGMQTGGRSLVFLSWTPSEVVTPESDFISVVFKRCDYDNDTYMHSNSSVFLHVNTECRYEPNRLVKIVWTRLESIAKPAYEGLLQILLTKPDFDRMLVDYNARGANRSSSDIDDVACRWMRDNEETWAQWQRVITISEKHELYIGGIFPLTGSTYTASSIIVAAKMAKNAINANSTVLRDYNLNILAQDGKCRADMVLKRFIDYIVKQYPNLVGVLGPACSDTVEPLAGIAKHYKTMVISYSAEGASLSDRAKYPYFFRTIGENKHYIHVYLQLFQSMGWKRASALSEDGQKYTEYISYLESLLKKNGIAFIMNAKFPRDRDKNMLRKYLEDLKHNRARIIIGDVYDEVARSVMCEAHKLEMTAKQGYVWFLPLWLSPHWYNTTYYNAMANEDVPCSVSTMVDAINGHLGLTHAYFAPENHIMQENITVGEWKAQYQQECSKIKNNSISNYGGYAYDAVWTYALALDKLIKDDPEAISDMHSENTTMKLLAKIQETDFVGVSGRIKFRGGPSRFSVINIMQWINGSTRIVGSFYPNISEDRPEILGGSLKLGPNPIIWLTEDGSRPEDGSEPLPRCVLSGLSELLGVTCEVAIVIVNLIGLAILAVALIVIVYLVKRRYEQKVQLTKNYMKSLGIDLLSAANVCTLDKWEIQRDRVVINRKLGEGAFGTVYGGEANFPDKGWVAVAVKTLKVGSTTEEKLDFLSEAEVMKRFDHKNIVKLLGVCTKNEPVYTIMEFMLYGDLKTFLLARRHIVNDKSFEESDEISSKKLTSMALDLARALSYLAELKYVHRDIASRNCLVNSQRVIKLGDFGMTRPMFENDYYKFNRKGMLPVRWMAPESLALGIFTPASDVWSFGVLLYEVITFGSFPFQGLSNNQVLEHVKAGNTIKIPNGVKPQLEGLIRACWNLDHKTRPQASEIVEFLANNPRLISPCLDVPLASVQMEDTGQLEIQIPARLQQGSGKTPDPIEMETLIEVTHPDVHDAANTVSIPLDECGALEPLLGTASSKKLGKYVTLQPAAQQPNQMVRPNPDYCNHDASSRQTSPKKQAVSIL